MSGERVPDLGCFYKEIGDTYGMDCLKDCKEFAKYSKKLGRTLSAKNFLLQCRRYGVIPKFISNAISSDRIRGIFNVDVDKDLLVSSKEYLRINNDIKKMCNRMNCRVLNILIRDKFVRCGKYQKLVTSLKTRITSVISTDLAECFFTSQERGVKKSTMLLDRVHKKKIDQLKQDIFKKMNIDLRMENDWFVNLSETIIPEEVKWLLSLGKKFAIPHDSKDVPLFRIIADVENCITKVRDTGIQSNMRSDICTYLGRAYKNVRMGEFGKFIKGIYIDAKKFVSENRYLMVTQADKGGKTVIMKKKDYEDKLLELVTDRNNYRPLRKDITASNQVTNNELVKLLWDRGHIDEQTRRSLTIHNALPPKIYGLPKIHKEGTPLRPIVSSINSPAYFLSKFLGEILKQWTVNSTFNVKNSSDFIEKVAGLEIGVGDCMVSYDVTSLFTNVPIDHALKLIERDWNKKSHLTNIPKDIFLKLLKFCLVDNNYFLYNDKFYRQVSGAPMGGPLSPIVADILMEDLLEVSVRKLASPPKVLTKYVDDVFTVLDRNQVLPFLKILNTYHNKIKFTYEIEDRGRLPYLDVELTISNGRIMNNWYSKPTASGRILNYFSSHPKHQILNTAKGLIGRVIRLSDKSFHKVNLSKIEQILTKNNFPRQVIEKLIHEVLHKSRNSESMSNLTRLLHKEERWYVAATYVPGISEYIERHMTDADNRIKMSFSSSMKLGNIFTQLKDRTDVSLRSNVVYEVPCNGSPSEICNMRYIGTTKQYLKSRMSNHRSDINAGRGDKSALAHHCIFNKHRPGLDDVKVLCSEHNVKKRFVMESLYIQAKDNTMNRKQDIDNAHGVYESLVHKFIRKGRSFS